MKRVFITVLSLILLVCLLGVPVFASGFGEGAGEGGGGQSDGEGGFGGEGDADTFLNYAGVLLNGAWSFLTTVRVPGFRSLTFGALFISILIVKIGLSVLKMIFGIGGSDESDKNSGL